ncbi:N-acetylmuramoyl-L-alanine amidase [Epilithonimonas zeae]|uniref:N-acetylmuramoyl-L-alanine amidase n=1 Tax=Epilithonimonas zeae TaxID=1416779 RepID=A0A1N6EFD4_9FLAO|nr:N-acetylmuramoyl-L-alanine amidase [Epilithonimonas zeae]SIN81651.1 N-acetylmuramoyl-L-alanine amidase [Epilithonimonas zeae]
MRNSLYLITLGTLIISCGTQQKTAKKISPALPNAPKPIVQVKKPEIKEEDGEYYRVNIADITKNDNTASYGSIVSANPSGFKIVKTYFPAIGQNFRQKYVILHYTVLNDEKSITTLTQQSVSAHYLVSTLPDKEIYQLVDENKRSYHAGVSNWRKDQNLNDTSIGIEIVNLGYTTDSLNNRVFYPYPEEQFKKVAALVKDIVTRYNIPPTNILAHSDIAPTRKQDPGPLFPWKRLYDDYQVGMWYDETTKQNFLNQILTTNDIVLQYNNPEFVSKIQQQLVQFGYTLSVNGVWDKTTKQTIEAFQFHFRPSNYSGILDAETWAILQALIQKYPQK